MKSCVSLLSAVCGQPDDVMERWLDLYYQVRHAKEKADAAARAAERLKEMTQLEAMPEADPPKGEPRAAKAPARQDAPTEKDEAAEEPETKPEPLREKYLPKEDPSQSAAPTALPGGASQGPVKRQGGKGKPRPSQIGNTRVHDAAVFKRQVRDRLVAVREKGVSAPEIVRAAPAGSVKESDIYMILQGHVIKIDIYRALDEAIRHFEN